MSPSSLLNVRASWSRFQEPSIRQHQGIFDPRASDSQPPRRSTSATTSTSRDSSSTTIVRRSRGHVRRRHQLEIYSFQPTWTLIRGQPQLPHRLRFPRLSQESVAERRTRPGSTTSPAAAVLTRQLDNSPSPAIGQDLAALLLGMPERRQIDGAPIASTRCMYQRRVRPGRLESHQQADAQSRSALRVRRGADRA